MSWNRLALCSATIVLLAAGSGGLNAQSVLSKAARTSDSLEPALVHPEQAASAQGKLDALFAATGKRPNIVWLVVDDMGYGDPGAFGGGAAIGAATPNMDRLAREGMKLTSAYSQATCTPTRSAILTGRLPVRTGLDAADPRGRHADQEPVGGRDLAADAARRRRLCDGSLRQVARRRGRGDAAARRRLR